MDQETITAETLLRDIYQAEATLRWFEQKYALLSEVFYSLYHRGQLRDEDPDEIREYLEWASWWEIYQDRRARYQEAIEDQLKTLSAPASLDELHISRLKIPAQFMSSALESYARYTQLIQSLLADRPTVASHALAVYTVSQTVGMTRGQVFFHSGHVLHVFEQIDFLSQRIVKYFYELTCEGESLWWYDPMPHPDVPDLQSTHPHHKHIPPDVKHHRIPAPELSFAEPNLPWLLEEAESFISNGGTPQDQR